MEILEKLKNIKNDIISQGVSMIGSERMQNILECSQSVLTNKIQGDFVETGVWKGGACIFMRSILKEFEDNSRKIFVCDFFEGLPKDEMPRDLVHHSVTDLARNHYNNLAISLEDVQSYFKNFNVLDEQVVFVKGWFKDTLPCLQTETIALLRLDGDMYSSTMDALNSLYFKVSKGGFIIIDDYGHFPQCKEAVDEFRTANNIKDQIVQIDYTGVFWKKGEE